MRLQSSKYVFHADCWCLVICFQHWQASRLLPSLGTFQGVARESARDGSRYKPCLTSLRSSFLQGYPFELEAQFLLGLQMQRLFNLQTA